MSNTIPYKAIECLQDNGPNYWIVSTGLFKAPELARCPNKATAELLARMVNSHAPMLEALKQIVWKTSGNFKLSNYEGPAYITRQDITIKMANEAIAKAEGRAI